MTSTVFPVVDVFSSSSEATHEADDDDDDGNSRVLVFHVVVALVLVALILFAIAGNSLVVAAVVLDINLRRTNNYFVVSLACADTLVAAVVMTFALVNDLLGRWMFGDAVCRLWMSADVMCSTASILSLCAVSFDRYVHVRRPLNYERWMTPCRALAAVLGVWALSTLISFVPIHLDWHRQHHEVAGRQGNSSDGQLPMTDDDGNVETTKQDMTSQISTVPSDNACTMALNPTYAIVSSLVSFYAPCLVMVVIYAKMYRYARFHADNIRQLTAIAGVCAATSARTLGGGVLVRNRLHIAEHKAAITLGVIMGVFLFCWAPFFTINVVGAVRPASVDPVLFTVCSWLGYLNSTMNPVIYCVFNQDFRVAFKRILLSVPPPRTFSFQRPQSGSERSACIYRVPVGTMDSLADAAAVAVVSVPASPTACDGGPEMTPCWNSVTVSLITSPTDLTLVSNGQTFSTVQLQ